MRVGIFDFENPLDEAHKRLRGFGLTAEDHDGLVYFHMPAINLQLPEGQAELAAAIERHRLDLSVIDSLRRAAPGLEENDSAAVSAVFSPLRALTGRSGHTLLVVHHARKRIGDNPTEAGQMVRGSGDLVASVDTLFYLRSKESGSFTLEHAASRRGLPHEPILVRIEGEDGRLELVNEGPVAMADGKVEATLARIVEALREDGGALPRHLHACAQARLAAEHARQERPREADRPDSLFACRRDEVSPFSRVATRLANALAKEHGYAFSRVATTYRGG